MFATLKKILSKPTPAIKHPSDDLDEALKGMTLNEYNRTMAGLEKILNPLQDFSFSNKENISDQEKLNAREFEILIYQIAEMKDFKIDQEASFEFEALQEIHQYLYNPLYKWGGEIRTQEFTKEEYLNIIKFPTPGRIKESIYNAFKNIQSGRFIVEMSEAEYQQKLCQYGLWVFGIHPFKKGNTVSTVLYMEKLAEKIDRPIDTSMFPPKSYQQAFIRAGTKNDFSHLQNLIARARAFAIHQSKVSPPKIALFDD